MIRHVRRVVSLLLLSSLATVSFAGETEKAKRPNIVAIVTDDQGRWALGCYGNRDVRTPRLDALAAAGAVHDNAFTVTPVCSPSRAAYLSGLWPSEVGITDWISPEEASEGLGLDAPTWPAALQSAGYQTGLFGKWHLGERPEFHPTRRGFDRFTGFLSGGNTPMNAVLEVDGARTQTEGPLPDYLTDQAMAFIRTAPADRPFCVCLHFREPHLPYGPVPAEDSAPFVGAEIAIPDHPGLNAKQVRESTRAYYASVHAVDRNVGRLLDLLDQMKLAENTIVIFTSDHGYNEGRHGIDTKGNGHWLAGGVRGPKRPNLWDTSLQVPLLVRWPGKIRPGLRLSSPVTNLDTYRTVLGLVGAPVPEGARARGLDWSAELFEKPAAAREATYAQYDLHNGGLAYLRSIRTDRYKYVRHFRARGMDELYDLVADPGETKNLAGRPQLAPVVADLRDRLLAWQRSIDDPVLRDEY
jgi:uncharacterized sulfatase